MNIPTIDLAQTGANIVSLRKAAGLTVADIQMVFGFNSPQAIYKWQNGTALPTVDNLIVLAALLNVRIDDIQAVMLGSSPARITITMGYSQVVKAPVFDTGIVGSSPAIPAMIRYSSGSRGQTANLLIAGWRQKLQPIKCNCPVGSCSRRLDGAKPLFSHKRKCKSNPARISTRSLRLVG